MKAEGPVLHEVQRLPTSGARAVEPFEIEGATYLAVPQLARDIDGQTPSMAAGDSDVQMPIYRWQEGRFVEHQRLDAPGGEDAECFAIGERRFLAVASLRRGRGPYEMDVPSTIHEWRGGRFVPYQDVMGHAAKQWRHFEFDGRHFLALAQGAAHAQSEATVRSCVLEWDGSRFVHLQDVPSAWGYNWLFLEVDGQRLLLHADHIAPSCVLRWNGARFEPLQQLEGTSGRAFCAFRAGGALWVAHARLLADSVLLRWDGRRLVEHATLSGPGAREFAWQPGGEDGGFLAQVNFILGSREAPRPLMRSVLHAWRSGGLEAVETFDTSGGTDAAFFETDGARWLAVSNSLAPDLRFRTDTCIYRFDAGA